MKQTSTIGKLALVLALIVGFIVLRDNWPFSRNDTVSGYTQKWGKVEADKINSIAIASESATLALTKDGSVWKVDTFQADSEAIAGWLPKLIKPENPELISENRENHAKLGFSDKPKKVTLKTGENTEVAVELGNVSGTGRYVKFAGEDRVYLVDGLPPTLDSIQLKDWVNKTLTKWEQKDIQKLSLERGRAKTTLTQNEGKWFVEGKNEAIDMTPLNSLLMNLTSLSTTGLAEDQKMTVKAPEVKVVVTTKEGDTTLLFSPFKDQDYIVSSSVRDGKFLISKSTVDTLTIDPTALKPAPTSTPAPSPTGK